MKVLNYWKEHIHHISKSTVHRVEQQADSSSSTKSVMSLKVYVIVRTSVFPCIAVMEDRFYCSNVKVENLYKF